MCFNQIYDFLKIIWGAWVISGAGVDVAFLVSSIYISDDEDSTIMKTRETTTTKK